MAARHHKNLIFYRCATDILCGEGSPLGHIKKYLLQDRVGLLGCKVGRLVNENSVVESSVQEPIGRYFKRLLNLMEGALLQAKEAGEIRDDVKRVCLVLLAGVQGGFVLSRVQPDEKAMRATMKGLCDYLDLLAA